MKGDAHSAWLCSLPFPLLIGTVILVVLLAIEWRQRHSLSYLLRFSVFWVYLLLVLSVTVFPIPLPSDVGEIVTKQRVMWTFSRVNLVPLYYGNFPNMRILLQEIVQNIAMTVPLGFGVSFIAQLRAKDLARLAVAVGLGIEATQLVISLGVGGPYRTVDINDVLLNATGVLIGYGSFRLLAWLYLAMTQRLGIKHSGLSAYVHDVASRAQGTERAMPGQRRLR